MNFDLFELISSLKPFYKFRNDFIHSAEGLDIITLNVELKKQGAEIAEIILTKLEQSTFSLANQVFIEIDNSIRQYYNS